MGWDLVELEQAALLAVREAEEGESHDGDETGEHGPPQGLGVDTSVEDEVELLASQLQATGLAGKQHCH